MLADAGFHEQGSTGIQLVPALQPRAKTLTHLIRGKGWVTMALSSDVMLSLTGKEPETTDCRRTPICFIDAGAHNRRVSFSPEFKRKVNDPEYYRRFRHEVEAAMHVSIVLPYFLLQLKRLTYSYRDSVLFISRDRRSNRLSRILSDRG